MPHADSSRFSMPQKNIGWTRVRAQLHPVQGILQWLIEGHNKGISSAEVCWLLTVDGGLFGNASRWFVGLTTRRVRKGVEIVRVTHESTAYFLQLSPCLDQASHCVWRCRCTIDDHHWPTMLAVSTFPDPSSKLHCLRLLSIMITYPTTAACTTTSCIFLSAMNSSTDSSIDALVARSTVEDYNTFRYVLVRRLQPQLVVLTPASGGQFVTVSGSSTLAESERTKFLNKLQYALETLEFPSRVKLTWWLC